MERNLTQLVAEVISRLARRLGADGSQGRLIAVLCGATAGFTEAVNQIRALSLDGYRIELAFSAAADELYGRVFREQLTGFPHIGILSASGWLRALGESRSVVIPLLSANTLSKVSLLLADNLVTNVILHALFMGKTVVAARNGAHPDDKAREAHGFHRASPALRAALLERFHTVSAYGCTFTDASELRDAMNAVLKTDGTKWMQRETAAPVPKPSVQTGRRVLSAADIMRVHPLGKDLKVSHGTIVTPLARELAWRCGVDIKESE